MSAARPEFVDRSAAAEPCCITIGSKRSAAVVAEVVDDRARNDFFQPERPIAFGGCALKSSAKGLQFPNARFEIGQVVFKHGAHVLALLASPSVHRCEEFPDLAEVQAKLLCSFDELDALDRVGPIQAKSTTRARRCRQKAHPLVIPHRIGRQAGSGGDRPYSKICLMCLRHVSVPEVSSQVTRSLDEIIQSGVGLQSQALPLDEPEHAFHLESEHPRRLGRHPATVVVKPMNTRARVRRRASRL